MSLGKPAREPIPVTPMHMLYRVARTIGQKGRLELARMFVQVPKALDLIFKESVDAYADRYTNIGEAFHPTHRKLLPPGEEISTGYDLARILADPSRTRWKIEGAPKLAFRFVDYEVAPLRTTGGARYENGKRGRGPVADLLLVTSDGTPVIGEIKAATATRYDTDPVMALIQGLTLAAALATPQQRQRLADHYPKAGFNGDGQIGLYVLSVKPVVPPPRAKYQEDLAIEARKLADAIRRRPSFSAALKHLEFVEAHWNGTSLRLVKGA